MCYYEQFLILTMPIHLSVYQEQIIECILYCKMMNIEGKLLLLPECPFFLDDEIEQASSITYKQNHSL